MHSEPECRFYWKKSISQKRLNRLGCTIYHWICLGPGLVLGFWKSGSGSRFAGKPVKTGLASSRNTIVLILMFWWLGAHFLYKILQIQNFIRPDPVKKPAKPEKLKFMNTQHVTYHFSYFFMESSFLTLDLLGFFRLHILEAFLCSYKIDWI